MVSIHRFWLPLAVLGWMACRPVPVRADEGIRCEAIASEAVETGRSVERIPYPFSGGRALLLEKCRAGAGRNYSYRRIDVSVWEDGERLERQTLFNGIAGEGGVRHRVDADDGRVRIRYDCRTPRRRRSGDRSKWCHRAWHWSSIYDRLVEVSVSGRKRRAEQYYLRQFETSLARNDFDQATDAVRRIAGVAGPENADWRMELNRRLLAEIQRHARELRSREGTSRAVRFLERAFTTALPAEYEEAQYGADEVWLVPSFAKRRRESGLDWAREGKSLVERTDGNRELFRSMALLLAASEPHRGLATRVLREIVETFPDHPPSRLKYADVLWRSGHKERAREQYRRYRRRLRPDGGGEPDVPTRVDERVGSE